MHHNNMVTNYKNTLMHSKYFLSERQVLAKTMVYLREEEIIGYYDGKYDKILRYEEPY